VWGTTGIGNSLFIGAASLCAPALRPGRLDTDIRYVIPKEGTLT